MRKPAHTHIQNSNCCIIHQVLFLQTNLQKYRFIIRYDQPGDINRCIEKIRYILDFFIAKTCSCLSELKRNNLLIIIFFFSFSQSLYFSNQITFFSFIIGQNQLLNQSTNPIANNFRTKEEKKRKENECLLLLFPFA